MTAADDRDAPAGSAGVRRALGSIDPRARVLVTILVMLAAFVAPAWLGVILAATGLGLALAVGDGTARRRVAGLTVGGFVVAFVLNTWLVGLFHDRAGGGDALPALAGVRFGGRIATLAAWSQLLALTTRAELSAEAIGALIAPLARVLGNRVHAAIFQLQLVVRFTPLLLDEARRIHECQRLRGLSIGGGWRDRARALVPLFTPVFAGALLRAGALAEHLIARGYRPGLARPYLVGRRWHARDTAAVVVASATVLVGLAASRLGT